jgi:hypothetical protein
MPDEFERVTRDERQRRSVGRIQHLDVFRIHDPGLRDSVVQRPIGSRQFQHVSDVHAAERPKHRVAVPGDPDIAALAGEGRVFDVSRGAREDRVSAALEDRRRQVDRRCLQACYPGARLVR